jgi:diguanylate cyclase (GGDEF)-like protein/PAS domain S-box-containing protein
MFESIAPAGAKASVLLLNPEDKKLYIGAAPSLSNVLKSAFNGFITGNNKASCGTAAYLGETVIVEDVASSNLWNDFKDFGIDNGILACWSTPFFSENGEVLGTFAISHPKIISPTKHDIERLEMGGYLASIVVVRTRSIQALLNSENKFSTAFRSIPDVVSIASVPDGKFLEVNDHFLDKSGYERDEVIGRTVFELGIWADVTERDQLMSELKEHGVVRDMETKFLSRFGKVHDCLVSAEIITIEQQNYSLAITKDITEQKRLEILQTSRNQILESLAKNHELDTILRMIVVSITDLIPESSISILMSDKDGKYLFNGVSHNLPDFFLESINGLEIATSSCPCTRAANTRKSIIVSDFNNDPDCVNLIELVQQAGLAACWVQPIISSQDNVLGTFTLYFKRAREPGKDEIEIIDSVTRLASIAIERKRDEKTLRESEARFRSAFGNAPTGTALVDKTGVVLQVNARSTSIIGFLPEEIVGKSIVDITHPNDLEKSLEKYKELMTGQIDEYQLEKQYANKQGTYVWCRLSISSVKDDGGIPQYSIAHIEDISERKKSEESLHRYNRALQVLNQCNATLFHSTNAEELLNEVCKIVVQMGGYRFAWVGYIQDDEEKTIKPMAKSGYEEGYLDVKICLNTNDKNYCSLTDAINSLEVKAIRNIKTEKAELNWRDAALKRGYYSTISLPLIVDAQAFGAISIYSGEVDVFDKDEITLLKNLAENLSFGIQSITNRSVREEAEQSLRLSERKFRTLFDENPCMFFTVDDNANILSVNKFGAAELGYKTHQFIGRTLFSVTNDEGMLSVKNYLTECLKNPNKVHRWEMQAARKNGSKLWVRVLARVADDENHKNTILVVCEDITEAHLLSEKLKHEATHDGLTGLINRREFEERLQRAIQSAQKNNQHVLCYLDLDRFKIINDTCGHIAGDKLLKQLSDLLHSHLRSRDSLARLGGDEFGLLIENCEVKTALNIANKLKQEISGFQFYCEEKVFKVGVSIGMVEISARTTDVSDILMLADNACYTAKDKGRDRIYVHEEGDAELENRRNDMLWTTRIQQAFEEDRFRLAYQSIIPIDQIDNKGEHGEILLRMEDEEGNIIPPNAFIPVAERYNQISSIDKHVIEMTFKWLNENHDFLERLYLVSINLSGPSLVDGDVLKCIIQNLLKYNIPGNKICFEITETAAIANLSNANNFISVLKEHGCYFALDDFGSGLSSFAYLKALPVDFLKIDGAFVRDIEHEQGDLAIVKSIHEIGRALNKKTIAEFVENESILQILKGIGVNYAQGFGIDRPRPLIDINTKTNKIEISKKAS